MARNIDFTKHSQPVQLAAHAIGLDHKRPYMRHGKTFYRPYRNRYCAPVGEQYHAYKVWKGLCENGYAACNEHNQGSNHFATFWLTRAGLDWLGETLGITIYDEGD